MKYRDSKLYISVFSDTIGEWAHDRNWKQVPVYWDNARLKIMTSASSHEEIFL